MSVHPNTSVDNSTAGLKLICRGNFTKPSILISPSRSQPMIYMAYPVEVHTSPRVLKTQISSHLIRAVTQHEAMFGGVYIEIRSQHISSRLTIFPVRSLSFFAEKSELSCAPVAVAFKSMGLG